MRFSDPLLLSFIAFVAFRRSGNIKIDRPSRVSSPPITLDRCFEKRCVGV
jgi:hypothetical protein